MTLPPCSLRTFQNGTGSRLVSRSMDHTIEEEYICSGGPRNPVEALQNCCTAGRVMLLSCHVTRVSQT